MFTGIIETLGVVTNIVKEQENVHFTIKSDITKELKIDQSVAHNGVCLTVVAIDNDEYTVTAIKETLDKIGDNPVYITFDLDSLDSSVAPAVSNIEPGFTGFTIDEAKALIQSVKNKNVIGGDVVCLMPTKDQKNNITAMVAASIMFEIISVIAFK